MIKKSLIEQELEVLLKNWIEYPNLKFIFNSALQKAREKIKKKIFCEECKMYPCDITCPKEILVVYYSEVEKVI